VAGGGGEAGSGVTMARRIAMGDVRSFSGVDILRGMLLEKSNIPRGEGGGLAAEGV
jgi:hypothetical protein